MLPEGLVNQILQTDCVQGMQQLPGCRIPLTVTVAALRQFPDIWRSSL